MKVKDLLERYNDYTLWAILSDKEREELIEEEFKPKRFARFLTARKYGVSIEAIKKDHQKLSLGQK